MWWGSWGNGVVHFDPFWNPIILCKETLILHCVTSKVGAHSKESLQMHTMHKRPSHKVSDCAIWQWWASIRGWVGS